MVYYNIWDNQAYQNIPSLLCIQGCPYLYLSFTDYKKKTVEHTVLSKFCTHACKVAPVSQMLLLILVTYVTIYEQLFLTVHAVSL